MKGFIKFATLALGVLAALTVSEPLFAQCSTSAWTSVTGSPQALGTSTNPVGQKYEGSCALNVDVGGAPAFVTTDAPLNEVRFSARFYVFYENIDLSAGDAIVFRARNGNARRAEVWLRDIDGVVHLVAYYHSGGGLVKYTDEVPALGIWHAVEVSWSAGNGNGTFMLTVDGEPYTALTNLDNSGQVINQFDLGVINGAGGSGRVLLDAFEVREIGPVGLLAVNELRNLSTRADVQTDDYIVIGGFIVSGNTDKCVIVRARGPSVNVASPTVADPMLRLYSGSSLLVTNDDWQDSPEAPIIQALGRAPADPAESALFTCLPQGAYTALVSGVGGETGVGLVEVFDEDLGTPYLQNISTRALVGTGDLIAIGGFVVRGDQPKQVLIRGRGPTVGVPAGVTRLSDPRLRLAQGATVLETNDDWGDAPNASQIVATGRAPDNAAESAILITLPPGDYTALLDGSGGATGVGIIEVFDQSGGSVESL